MTTSSTSTTTAETDPRPILERAIATAGSVIAAVRPDQLAARTPCDDMDAEAMFTHLVGVLDRIAALGNGEDPFAVVEAVLPRDRWESAWADAAQRIDDAWSDDAVLAAPMALPWVQGTGADVLSSYFSELTVHTWDLATATGQQPEWDDVVVAAAAAGSRQMLPAENRLAMYEEVAAAMGLDDVGVPFAEVVPVPDDASPIDQLVAWNGRNPAAE